ncbi:hypothetical protein ABZS29_38515 [Kribbella sp. NPDC005582]|uniref:hypothetical protein n=1 Tax=Kribbella sp. NPDC005582 TaxID=3156893 RepID=UPI0033BA47CD
MADAQLWDGLFGGLIGASIGAVPATLALFSMRRANRHTAEANKTAAAALEEAKKANEATAAANEIAAAALEESRRSSAAAEAANKISTDALAAAKREAAAAEAANQIATTALEEASRSRELQEAQAHQQAKPNLTVECGDVPDQGWIPVHVRCDVAFDSATIALVDDEVRKLFAGLGPGPDNPHQHEFSPQLDLPATPAGRSITRGLWVFHAEPIEGKTVRFVCTVTRKAGLPPWEYVIPYEFERPPRLWGTS